MLFHKVLLAAAAAVTLAAPAAALADSHHDDNSGGYRGQVYRDHDRGRDRFAFQDRRSYGAYDPYAYERHDDRGDWRWREHHREDHRWRR